MFPSEELIEAIGSREHLIPGLPFDKMTAEPENASLDRRVKRQVNSSLWKDADPRIAEVEEAKQRLAELKTQKWSYLS